MIRRILEVIRFYFIQKFNFGIFPIQELRITDIYKESKYHDLLMICIQQGGVFCPTAIISKDKKIKETPFGNIEHLEQFYATPQQKQLQIEGAKINDIFKDRVDDKTNDKPIEKIIYKYCLSKKNKAIFKLTMAQFPDFAKNLRPGDYIFIIY